MTTNKKQTLLLLLTVMLTLQFAAGPAMAQPEVMAWSNLQGIRVEGQLMAFETSLRVVWSDWSTVSRTAKERQWTRFNREGDLQVVDTRFDSLFFHQTVKDLGSGGAKIDVELSPHADTSIVGAFFCVELPGADYAGGQIELIAPTAQTLQPGLPAAPNEILRMTAAGVRLISPKQQLEVTFPEATELIVTTEERRGVTNFVVHLPIHTGALSAGQSAQKSYTVRATGEIDRSPVRLTLNTNEIGRPFDGLGGNFRFQNPRTDPQVISYCLDNLRVAWARVDMPWMLWQPSDTIDPIEAAKAGQLHPRVKTSLEMAQRLGKMNIPVMLAVWFPPQWAILGERNWRPGPGEPRGNQLNPERMEEIYESLTSYIRYLRDEYGVEALMFSFNESDLGIDVRQTDVEHAELIKELGAYFASKGLKTKLLLGDTADANGYDFINVAMDDPETHPYMGFVSFHSWRGWADTTLTKWAAAAERMTIPLIVGEGSIDAAAWRYPAIFQETTYAMEEINLYLRLLAICQPLTILQWQLTADYSPLAGGGIFGDEGPLRPTQRFWNLKQLASTPAGLFHMPIKSDKESVTCAALGDKEKRTYAIHLVNNGPTREATITGLPDNMRRLTIYVTDKNRHMHEGEKLRVRNGQVQFTLEAGTFTSLMTE